jgi:hypothetical protein
MNDQEEIQAYLAMCKCCLLAQAMKDCPRCRFNLGLAEPSPLAATKPTLARGEMYPRSSRMRLEKTQVRSNLTNPRKKELVHHEYIE